MKKTLLFRWQGLGGGKGIFLLVILFLYVQNFMTNTLFSQTTFNKEKKVMDFISQAGPVITYGDTIYCLGYGTDFYSYQYYNLFFSKFDMEGNFIKRYIDTLGDYYFSRINDAYIVDNHIISIVDSYKQDVFIGSYIENDKV